MNIFLASVFDNFLNILKEFASDNIILIIIIALILPFVEAVFPVLPLIGIVSFNIVTLTAIYGSLNGVLLGVVISSIGSMIGMLVVFLGIRDLLGGWFNKKIKDKEKITKAMEWISNRSNTFMILFMSNPYIPTAIFNYAMALTNYNTKKYLLIVVISRIICIGLLGLLGVVFKVGSSFKSIILIFLTYIAVYFIIWLLKKCFNRGKIERKKDYEKNY